MTQITFSNTELYEGVTLNECCNEEKRSKGSVVEVLPQSGWISDAANECTRNGKVTKYQKTFLLF